MDLMRGSKRRIGRCELSGSFLLFVLLLPGQSASASSWAWNLPLSAPGVSASDLQALWDEDCVQGPATTPPPRYPPQEVRQGIGGVVEVEVVTNRCGQPRRVRIVRSSGNRNLDASTRMAAEAWVLPAAPTIGPLVSKLPITFTPPHVQSAPCPPFIIANPRGAPRGAPEILASARDVRLNSVEGPGFRRSDRFDQSGRAIYIAEFVEGSEFNGAYLAGENSGYGPIALIPHCELERRVCRKFMQLVKSWKGRWPESQCQASRG
jgi:TonB family protein